MEVIGYIAALFIGISLGLIGGGGSILTVPVLVYLFGISPIVAISYSLFIVGTTSFIGVVSKFKSGLVDLRTALIFGITSIITTFTIRKFIIPVIPEQISVADFSFSFSVLTMILFAVLMVFASVSMIRGSKKNIKLSSSKSILKLPLYGITIGLITGFLGAGGGFLLIPALVLLLHLPMKKAVGTSLLIIALNSLIGFIADRGNYSIDWNFLLIITLISIGGVFVGGLLSKKISGYKLKKGFGWFVLLMGIFIIFKETLSN